MFLLLCSLSLIGCALSEAPYPASGTKPDGALLLLPQQQYGTPAQTEASFRGSEAEDLAKLTDQVMERLRQEAGSDSGSYHVYLSDGRLQQVQYTTAPLRDGQQAAEQNSDFTASQQYQGFSSGSQVDTFGLNPPPASTERLQQTYQPQSSQLFQQQQQFGQYNQGEGSSASPARVQQHQQYFQNGQSSSQVFSQLQRTGESEQPHPVIQQFGRFQQQLQSQQIQRLTDRLQYLEQEQQRLQEQQEQLKSASYVASLRFSNVDPISSPIYSYKSDGLTRVLRYAPYF